MSKKDIFPAQMTPAELAKDFRATEKGLMAKVNEGGKKSDGLLSLAVKLENLAIAVEEGSPRKAQSLRIGHAAHELKKLGKKVLDSKDVGEKEGFGSENAVVREITLAFFLSKMHRANLKAVRKSNINYVRPASTKANELRAG